MTDANAGAGGRTARTSVGRAEAPAWVAVASVPPRAPLPREFYARDAETVARALLGTVLVHRVGDRVLRARVVETEAYVGAHDLACHASKGRTSRTEVMFGPAGHAYVYLIYGMHHMLNAVTGETGDPQAVLIRAAEPLGGLDARLDGPGRLARALGVTGERNGADLCSGPLVFEPGRPPMRIAAAPRVGVDYAGEWSRAVLRFFDDDSAAVSRPHAPGERRGGTAEGA